ncbi:hypothetical protein SYJ56_06560 [Algoriphagus sp. D3-2-R+10]|uniref:hypothetical protein n=1 Tax=Algoriphagus aurantiacus TaxID=3103948 RepID=UPI002B3E7BE8|nr:hypothetical protein [Algoriphagus sp. D3-2-R+10]MEB2774959.1 hypothetical protein [Algoriphagus sp. D3-2-R+10]
MKIKLSLSYLAFLIFSCQSKDSQTENITNEPPSYKLETLDSVTVRDILAKSFLFQTADEDHLIFRDVISSEIYVFDRVGNPVDKWKKTGDVPGSFSYTSGQITQDKAGNLVVLDIMNGLKVLKKSGEVIQNFGIHQRQWSLGASISHFKSYQVIEKEGKEYLLYSLDVIEEATGDYDPEFLQKRKTLLLTELETEETKTILPFPEGSQFLNGNVFFFNDFRPVFSYDEKFQMLYIAFQNEPIIYTYDWSGAEPILKEKTPLDLDGFVPGKGFEKGVVSFAKISDYKINPYPSQIINLEKYGEDLLISYKPSPSDKGDLALVMADEVSKELRKKLNIETKTKTVVVTQKGDIIPLDLPEMNSYEFSVIGDDIWWMKKYNGEEEQEDYTVYRSRLVKN